MAPNGSIRNLLRTTKRPEGRPVASFDRRHKDDIGSVTVACDGNAVRQRFYISTFMDIQGNQAPTATARRQCRE